MNISEDTKKANKQAETLAKMLETDNGFKMLGEEAYKESKKSKNTLL